MARLTCALGPDNVGAILLAAFSQAQQSIEASIYEISDTYLWAFTEAASRGVHVRVVVDPRSDPQMRERALRLTNHQVECRLLSLPDSYAHAKLIVIDGARVAVGSGNLNFRDGPFAHRDGQLLKGTREWWLIADDVITLAKVARAHILRNWRAAVQPLGLVGDAELALGPPVHSVVPEVSPLEIDLTPRRLRLAAGGAGVRALEQELLNGPRKRVLVTVPYVDVVAPAVAPLLGALTAHARRGADVRLLLGQAPEVESAIAVLTHLEVPIRIMDSNAAATSTTGHAKGLICDDVVVVGSANWSEKGLSGNDEAALAVSHQDAANYYAAAIDRDWAVATPLV